MKVLGVGVVLLTLVGVISSGQETTIRTKAGGQALLPCNIAVPRSSKIDSLQVILWFKDEASIPIYTVDARESTNFWDATHGRPGGDGRLTMTSDPAALMIPNVRINDSGIYRCRVDFRQSPTRNSKIKLEVY